MKTLVGIVVYNEEDKIGPVIEGFRRGLADKVIIVNDCSTDNTLKNIQKTIGKVKGIKFKVVNHKKNLGVGACIRDVINYGMKNKFVICVIMAGNGKDNPSEIAKLTQPIVKEGFDYIQGSRFLKGGSYKNLPVFRRILIKAFTLLFSIFTGNKFTDTSNGFRAYKLSIFKDRRINLNQAWLDRYELETYLHYKVTSLGYKIKEVAVSKDYLPNVKRYSKIRPVIDWWKMFRPLLLLKLGLKN